MRVSTTQFSLQPIQEETHFWIRVEALLKQASLDQSDVVLFPEYFSLSWLLQRIRETTFRKNLERANELIPEFMDKFQAFAEQYKIAIVAGTVPVVEQNQIFNRSFIFRPGIAVLFQDKINMTRFENEEWQVASGKNNLNVFTLGDSLCAVTTCYDVEFPTVTALAGEQGVEVLFVPSCTEDIHGYWRVRHCAQARTIENQCYVVMSSIVGGFFGNPFQYG
jgi:predicted amidohydrolase